MDKKLDCPKCEIGILEKINHLLKCNNCGWSIEYIIYIDLKKLLGDKIFLEGEDNE